MILRCRFGLYLAPMLVAAALGGCARTLPPAPVVAGDAASPAIAAAPQLPVPHPDRIVVQRGETLYGIARRYEVPVRSLIEANGLVPPYELATGRSLVLPQVRRHVVQPGESLDTVARLHGVDTSTLARTNGIAPPYGIHVGDALALPAPVQVQAAPSPAQRTLPPVVYAVAPGRAASLSAPITPPSPQPPASAPPEEPKPAIASIKPLPVEATPLAPPAPPAAVAPPPRAEEVAVLPPPTPRAIVRTFLWPVKGRVIGTYGSGESGAHNDGLNIAAPKGTTVIAADAGTVAYAGNELRGYGDLVLIKHADGWMTAYAHNSELLVKRGEKVARGQAIAKVGATGAVGEPQLHFEIRHGAKALDPADYLPPQAATATNG